MTNAKSPSKGTSSPTDQSFISDMDSAAMPNPEVVNPGPVLTPGAPVEVPGIYNDALPLPADPDAQKTTSTTKADPKTNKGILGESAEALGGDKASLLETTDTGKPRYKSLSEPQKVMAQPDNSPAGLARNKLITDARAFVRGQGTADHLYSDEAVISEYERYQAWAPHNYGKTFDLNLVPTITYFHTPQGGSPTAVKSAEYATIEGALKPFYRDKEEADTPTPSDPKLPN